MMDRAAQDRPEDGRSLGFLVYRPRSGSTLFGDRIGRHPDIVVTPESNVAMRLAHRFRRDRDRLQSVTELVDFVLAEQKARDWGLPRENLIAAFGAEPPPTWQACFQRICLAYGGWKKPQARWIIVKKAGWYARNIGLLLDSYPGSVAVDIVRDPRATFNSSRASLHSERGDPIESNVLSSALGWRRHVGRMAALEAACPGRVSRHRYEDFIGDMTGVVQAVWRFLDVEAGSPDVLAALQASQQSPLVTPSTQHLHVNVGSGAIASRVDAWRSELPAWQAMVIEQVCRTGMQDLGYRP